MARYVDAERLIQNLKDAVERNKINEIAKDIVNDVINLLQREPTADVVEVPCRCSECKFLKIINEGTVYAECVKQKLTFLLWQADTREHFCSYGERKEGVDDAD